MSPPVLVEQAAILERIAIGAPLDGTLDEIVHHVERQIPGSIGSCLMLDATGRRLHGASVQGLPATYNEAIEGVEIGPNVGSCGTAAALGEAVYVADISSDPRWVDYRDVAAAHGLRACWSIPIRSRRQPGGVKVLGTFAVYFPVPRSPRKIDEQVLARAEYLACIALEADRAVSDLRTQEARFRAFVDHATDALFVHDASDGTIVEVNQQACESLGYSREELVGASPALFDSRFGSEEMRKLFREPWTEPILTFDSVHARKSGERFPVEIRIRGFESDGRRLNLALARDVSERRRLEEQLREAQKMDAIGRLAGGIAHDFNNLLTVINGCAEMLALEIPEGSSWRSDLTAIREAGERAAALTAQLLAFGRRSIIEPAALDLNAIVVRMARVFERLLGESVVLETKLAPDLRPVHADAGHVEQVLLNLVVNARDAMPAGGRLQIETSNVASRVAGGIAEPSVQLVVRDTGVGMSEDVQAHAFEPFFTTKSPDRGTGLGLATVHGIVSQAGGSVRIESNVGSGTRVIVRLRSIDGAVTEPAEPWDRLPTGDETILLVEDQADVRRVAQRALEACGHRVLAARSGEDALMIAREHAGRIDLVLTDVVMPGLGGRRLVDALHRVRPGLRVLYTSGYTDDEILRHGVISARDAFLHKPFTPITLARKVRDVLDAKD